LKILICDESIGEIAQVAKEFSPKLILQTCLKHYSANVDKEFKVNRVRRILKSLQNKLNKLGDSVLIPTHHYNRERARKWVNQIAEIESEYLYLIRIQSLFHKIFWKAETIEELGEIENELSNFIGQINLDTYPHAQKIIKRYKSYYQKHEQINAHLFHPELNIPRTTNLIEGFNSTTLELHFTSIRGFEKEKTARDYINALILQYRFHKFKCCKKPFTHLNGKSPLEIAQPFPHKNLASGKEWIEFCRKLKAKKPGQKEGG